MPAFVSPDDNTRVPELFVQPVGDPGQLNADTGGASCPRFRTSVRISTRRQIILVDMKSVSEFGQGCPETVRRCLLDPCK